MRIALIMTTYNRPYALELALQSCLQQTDRNFEVLVADDGSTEQTTELIQQYQAHTPVSLRHIWQEDLGFRAAAVRNRAVAASHSDYIVFTDGDCLMPPNFIARHRALAEPGWFLSGNRLMLTPTFTEQVITQKLPVYGWSKWKWLQARFAGNIERTLPLLSLPNWAILRKRLPDRWKGAKTSNLSVWRNDLLQVNGLDESYSGWGMEDSDLVIRLLRAGVHSKSARFAEPVFHLWHDEHDRSKLPANQARLQQVLQATHTQAHLGIDQYLVQPTRATICPTSEPEQLQHYKHAGNAAIPH